MNGVWAKLARQDAFHASAPAHGQGPARIVMLADIGLPQCRKYRVEQPAELWAKAGVGYDWADFRDVQRSLSALQSASHLMLYRVQSGPLLEMYLYEARRLGLPVAYDIDDPLFSVPAYETYGNMAALPGAMKAHFLAEAPKYLAAMNQADVITVSTPGLATHLRAFTHRPVLVRRNFADAATWAAAEAAPPRAENGGFRLAFASGSMGHEADFGLIRDCISDFLAADRLRRLMVLGHFDAAHLPKAVQGQIEIHGFADYADYLALLAQADCAVMPLLDDLFNGCKSAVRVLDAAAVGVVSVASDIGDMCAVIREGETGHLIGADGDWRAVLEKLAAQPAATAAMGQAAQAHLRTQWDGQPTPPVTEPKLLDWAKG